MHREVRNSIVGALVVLSLVVSVLIPVYAAAITGKVTAGLAGPIYAASLTAERVNTPVYRATTTSTGTYSLPIPDTQFYQVDAFKAAYNHAEKQNVAGGSTNQNLDIGAGRTIKTLNVRIAVDEEFRNLYGSNWPFYAESVVLMSAHPVFVAEHSITFIHYSNTGSTWVSNQANKSCQGFYNDVKSDTNWPTTNPGGGADILFAITAETMSNAVGCSVVPDGPNQKPIVVVKGTFTPIAKLVGHELTHAYGIPETCNSPSTQWYDLMVYQISGQVCGTVVTSKWTSNWRPSMDDTMEARRGWYD